MLTDLLQNLEHQNVTTFNSLDFKITDKEISGAISKLKSNKSGGLQLISNNMVKSAHNFILPSLKVLFNKILLSGIYPKIGQLDIFRLFSKRAVRMIQIIIVVLLLLAV